MSANIEVRHSAAAGSARQGQALAPHARGSLTLAHGLGFWRWWWVGA